jgi:hypothetical protein
LKVRFLPRSPLFPTVYSGLHRQFADTGGHWKQSKTHQRRTQVGRNSEAGGQKTWVFHVSQRSVQALKAPAQGIHSKVWYDDKAPGFGVRVSEAGVKAFVLNDSVAGRERRLTIGRWPEWSADAARAEAATLRVEIDKGVDPLADRQTARAEDTLAELAGRYIDDYALPHKREKSVYDDRRMLNNIILPKLGRLRISAVKRIDIERAARKSTFCFHRSWTAAENDGVLSRQNVGDKSTRNWRCGIPSVVILVPAHAGNLSRHVRVEVATMSTRTLRQARAALRLGHLRYPALSSKTQPIHANLSAKVSV